MRSVDVMAIHEEGGDSLNVQEPTTNRSQPRKIKGRLSPTPAV